MPGYTTGEVLGAATVLPATTAVSVFLLSKVHPMIIAGFMVVNLWVLALLLMRITRYWLNRRQ